MITIEDWLKTNELMMSTKNKLVPLPKTSKKRETTFL